jgi:chemotaxis protein methyltransferase CheR
VLNRMARALAPDGYLFLGGAETVLGLSSEFERNASKGVYYQKRQSLVSSSGARQEAAAG